MTDLPSVDRQKALLADWFDVVHYDELVDWHEAPVPVEDDDEAVVAAARPRDGDGDGFVYDGTPRQRPWNPLTDLPYPDGKVPDVVKRRQQVDRRKARSVEPPGPKRPIKRQPDKGWHDPRTAPPPVAREDIERAFTYSDDDGFFVEAKWVDDRYGLSVSGSIYRDLGQGKEDVGYFNRTIDTTRAGHYTVAKFEELYLEPQHQGRGLGSRLFASQVDGLRRAGVDRVDVAAVSDLSAETNGAYTWARAGYDWKPGSRNHRLSLGERLREAIADRRFKRRETARLALDMANKLDGLQEIPDDPADLPEDFPTPNDVAMLGWTPGATEWLGKDLMTGVLGSVRWDGSLYLDPDRQQLGVDDIGELPNPFADVLPGGETGSDTPTAVTFYEVGGAVRDDLMGIFSDDVDFAVTAPSYEAMKEHLEAEGFRIFQEREEFATIKAKVPDGHPLQERTHVADFVLARRDGPSSDGRRPDYTEPGSLEEDLARRDFTVNAIARDVDGNLIDPFGGQEDIESRTLRFVGDPMQRVREDGLRVLRGFRFMVTKQLTPEPETWRALTSDEAAEMLLSVSKERVSNELQKMLDYDTLGAVQLLGQLPTPVLDAIFRDGVRLSPNLGKVKGVQRDPNLPRTPLAPDNPFRVEAGDGSAIELGSGPAGWARVPAPGPDRPVERAELPPRSVEDWKPPTSTQLQRAFLKDLPNGYQVRARATGAGAVSARIYAPGTDDEVGFFNWEVRRDSPTAYLSLAQVAEQYQGQGIGSQAFAAAVESLREVGVDTIELLALSSGDSNGGYTWARAGFDWEPGWWELDDFAVRLATFARDGRRRFDVTPDDGDGGTIRLLPPEGSPYSTEDQQEAFRIAALLTTRGKDLPYDQREYPDDLPTPNDVAMIGWKPGAESWLGKDFLSGPNPITGGAQSWDGAMRIDNLDATNPFAETVDGGETASAPAAVPEPDVELSSIVRTGNPHRWNTNSGLGEDRVYFASGDLSKRTVNARVAAVKKLMVEELPQLRGKDFEIRYWTDWEEYRNAVWPSANTGSYPLAAWRDNGGRDGGAAVWVSPSIATGWFDDDPSAVTNWKVLVHELVHAASPQRVSNSGADAVLEEGMAEILSTDITARRIAEARVPFERHRFDGGGTVPGIEQLVRRSTYNDNVAQLILHAAEEVGEWDRTKIMAKVREWWDDGEYTSRYRRYELRGDARTREEMIEAEAAKINAEYDGLIARLPQHADEYEKNRRDLIEHLNTLYSTGNWQADANDNWERAVRSAEAAGVPIRSVSTTYTADDYVYEQPRYGRTPEQDSEAITVAQSLLYWLINGEAIDTAVSQSGEAAAEGPAAVGPAAP